VDTPELAASVYLHTKLDITIKHTSTIEQFQHMQAASLTPWLPVIQLTKHERMDRWMDGSWMNE